MRVVETHISVLVFVGDRVYKLRKPVHFDFLDFTDRAIREADCRREVELNRRLAPDVYLGVADIVMDGEPIDHMVVMRALPDERRLATLVRSGADVDGWLARGRRRPGGVPCRGRALRRPSPASATPAALETAMGGQLRGSESLRRERPGPGGGRQVRTLVQRWLLRYGPLLDARIAAGRVCDGHGDLQAEDVFCLDDGVRILDCIEFSDRLRYGDVCADVAFLAMDLERLGRPDAAERFVAEYESLASERFPAPLLHHYVAQRAYVRAKVACLQWEQGLEGAEDRPASCTPSPCATCAWPGRPWCWWAGCRARGRARWRPGWPRETGWAAALGRDPPRAAAARRGLAPAQHADRTGHGSLRAPKPSAPSMRSWCAGRASSSREGSR